MATKSREKVCKYCRPHQEFNHPQLLKRHVLSLHEGSKRYEMYAKEEEYLRFLEDHGPPGMV